MFAVFIQHSQTTGRFHPAYYREAPLPGGNYEHGRYKSVGHHTTGFDTIEEAQERAAELAGQLPVPVPVPEEGFGVIAVGEAGPDVLLGVGGGVPAMSGRYRNEDLTPLPPDDDFVEAVHVIVEGRHRLRLVVGATANEVAYALGVKGARRLGNGAVKGAWSGYMSGSLRTAPRLRKLAREGRLREEYDSSNHRSIYLPFRPPTEE